MSWIEQLKLCNVSRDQLLQLVRSLSLKLKTNLKDEMEDLIYDSLQCQC
jgi:hypothetical protein